MELLVNPEFPDEILVHYGMHLLEIVHRGRNSIEEKLLAGRLYNAGLKRSKLVEIFERDLKTIRGYAGALKSGDATRLKSVLSGQGPPSKISDIHAEFIRQTFRDVYEQHGCHSNSFIRSELERQFNLKVCYETMRKLLKAEKEKIRSGDWKSKSKSGKAKEQSIKSPDTKDNSCKIIAVPSSDFGQKHNYSPYFLPATSTGEAGTDGSQMVFHGGLFLALECILQISELAGGICEYVRQWLSSVLSGAVNIEQSIGLNFHSLAVILQQRIFSDEAQRQFLHTYASTDAVDRMRRANMKFIGADLEDTFLYDPHGIEYTGQATILKGWLGSKHKIAKAYYQDFIHTLGGKPAAAFLDDNYDDLRARFPRHVKAFRQLLSGKLNRTLTFVVDRAIYGLDDLRAYQNQRIHVITWEKGSGNPPWTPGHDEVGSFSFMRYRNHIDDTITYRVEHYSESWKREPSFKRHLARIYRGNDSCGVVLSVICTDSRREGRAVLEPILRRWVQENDILYLVNEFGINQITSYGKVSYTDIAQTIEDRQFDNPNTRKICAQKLTLRQKLGVEIVKHEDRMRQLQEDQENLERLTADLNASDVPEKKVKKDRKRLATSVKGKSKRLQKAAEKLQQLKIDYRKEIAHLDQQLEESPETLSRLETLIEDKYQKLTLGPKAVMDTVRIAARNIFGQLHEQFRPLYNNYRNDHRLLRELIRAPALITHRKNRIEVTLIPTRNYDKKQRRTVQKFLAQISNNNHSATISFDLYNNISRKLNGDF